MRDMMDLELEIADQTVMPMAGNLIRSSFTEGFDDIGLLPGMGWAIINNSEPIGVLTWFQEMMQSLQRMREIQLHI